MRLFTWRPAVAGVIVLAVAVGAATLPAAASITSVTLSSADAVQDTDCPADVKFAGTVVGTPSAPFAYWYHVFLNGQDTPSPAQSATMPASGIANVSFTVHVPITATNAATDYVRLIASTSATVRPGVPSNTLPYQVTCKPIPTPTHLRPVQSVQDCVDAFGSHDDANCESIVRQGGLQMIWDDAATRLDGYHVDRVTTSGDVQVADSKTASGQQLPRKYANIVKPNGGYTGSCYTVIAYRGEQTSAKSAPYCYAWDATATTETFDPKRVESRVTWSAPSISNCSPDISLNTFLTTANHGGTGFTLFFPWLLSQQQLAGNATHPDAIVGDEAMILDLHYSNGLFSLCATGELPTATVRIDSRAGVDFDLAKLAGHRIFSATLGLDVADAVGFSRDAELFYDGPKISCATDFDIALGEWWNSPTSWDYKKSSSTAENKAEPSVSSDVTPIVATWAGNRDLGDDGFIVRSVYSDVPVPLGPGACMTKYSNPRLTVVYF